jgi:hypothetical protein
MDLLADMKILGKAYHRADSAGYALNLQVGNVCCAIKSHDAAIYKRLKRLYRGFLTGQPADITVELEGTERFSLDDLNAALATTEYVHDNNCFRSSSEIVAGQYDLSRGFIKITGEKSLVNPDLELNCLNQLLALAYYSACKVKYDGNPPAMLLHACGILRSGKALLFTGPSEAGKTTIARLCEKRYGSVINDEMLLVSRPGSNGSGEDISVQSAPFLGGIPTLHKVTAPLRCILMLKKSDKTLVRPVAKTEAYLKLIRQIITPAYIGQKDKKAVISLMADFSTEVLKTIPVYELEFCLDGESIWRTVSELEK